MKNLSFIILFIGILLIPGFMHGANNKNEIPKKPESVSKPEVNQISLMATVTVTPEVTISDCPYDCQAQYCADLWLEIWSSCGPTFIESVQLSTTQCVYSFSSFQIDDACLLYTRIVDRGSPACSYPFNQQVSAGYSTSGGGTIKMNHYVCYP